MAINTQGFQVSVLPQLAQIDAAPIGQSVDIANRGLLQAFQAQETAAKLKAFQQAQAEAAATRQARIDAANAQNLAISQVAPVQTAASLQTIPALAGADVAKANQVMALAPVETEAKKATIPALANATVADAAAQAANSGIITQTAPARLKTALIQTSAAADRAPTVEETNDINAQAANIAASWNALLPPLEAAKKIKDLKEDLASDPNSKGELDKAVLRAKIDLDKAQGEYYHNHGTYLLNRPTQKVIPPSQLAQQYSSAIQKLEGIQVGPTKDDTLGAYEAARDAYLSRGAIGQFIHSKPPMNKNAELLLQQKNQLVGAQMAAIKAMVGEGLDAGDQLPAPATAAPASPAGDFSSAEGKIVLGPDGNSYLIKGGQPVRIQ